MTEAQMEEGKKCLFRAVLNHCGLSELIRQGERVLGCPVALSTAANFVWYVSEGIPKNQIIPQTGGTRIHLPSDMKKDRSRDDMMNDVLETGDGFFYHICEISDGTVPKGCSVLMSSEPVSDFMRQLHKTFCALAAQEMDRENVFQRISMMSEEEALILNLLEGGLRAEHYELLNQEHDYYELLVIGNSAGDDRIFSSEINIADEIRELFSSDICFAYYDMMLAVLPAGKWGEKADDLNRVLKKCGMQAGLSNPFRDYSQIRTYYQQAVFAFSHGRKEGVKQYTDCLAEDILLQAGEKTDRRDLLSSRLEELRKKGDRTGINYLETLRIYFEFRGNVKKTADVLGIHRNSVLGRLNRIKELLEIDELLSVDLFLALEWVCFCPGCVKEQERGAFVSCSQSAGETEWGISLRGRPASAFISTGAGASQQTCGDLITNSQEISARFYRQK